MTGMTSEDWLIVSALVQAGAALIIAAFTFALWRSTSKLAEVTQRDVELTEQIARIQSVVLAREVAPKLSAKSGGTNVGEDNVAGPIRIENIGGSAAHDIEVDTSWGTPVIAGPLLPGSKEMVTPVVSRTTGWEMRPDHAPIVYGFRFKDSQGARWKQTPGDDPMPVSE